MYILSKQSSVGNTFLNELRCESIQKDKMRFRKNMERIGQILSYEISKTLQYKDVEIKTPLGKAKGKTQISEVVLATILRAGIPFHQGFLDIFDHAENAFVASFRKEIREDGLFEIKTEYTVSPNLDNKVLILCDPMLATGQSLVLAYQSLLKYGTPAHTHIASIIGSVAGVKYVKENTKNTSLWLGDLDEALNSRAYIIPGLGDAGDLAFGKKI